MINIRCLNLDKSLSHSYDFNLISKINIRCGKYNQVLEGVD
jgi:hypothetical protein